eukprot:GFUD01001676.1.p1 GENE.GFUD01001676.1~~GFUD01001676.1.p1  ORF type:complete len:328 (-),score=128.60 GFUD01001676.1:57-1040(-)
MPLPPALAARLAKRGILRDASVAGYDPQLGKALDPQPQKGRGGVGGGGAGGRGDGVPSYGYEGRNLQQPEEEVFAESYDNESSETATGPLIFSKPEVDPTRYIGHAGCPNKWNVHHDCVLYCRQFWGVGIREPVNMEYIKAHNNMIEKYYPLPDGWREMYDAGVGRHYYWCTKTDKVSWLPPGHPKGSITDPASKVREMLVKKEKEKQEETDNADNMDLDTDNESDEEEDRRLEEQRRREKERRREEERRIVGKDKRGRKGRDDDTLDPMDPAAYSDVPRGNWATGLPDQASAKTGVDSTASGPLFQQRPYPSPGAILRANAAQQEN